MLNVLWVSNTVFPDAAKALGLPLPVFGGWMYGLASALSERDGIRLSVVTVYSGQHLEDIEANGVRYFLVPQNSKSCRLSTSENDWKYIADTFKPDIVHIHGTEFHYGMELMKASPDHVYVVSIQGMVSVIERYYLAGISPLSVLLNITIRDLLRFDTLFQGKKRFKKRGKVEVGYVKKVAAVIGRTSWDRAHVEAIKPDVRYFSNNECLRSEFYQGYSWSINSAVRFSIFLSQAAQPIKGLHNVIVAIALLRERFPQIRLRIAGPDIVSTPDIKSKLKLNGYGKYLRRLIDSLGVFGMIEFTGSLSAEKMREEYLRAHVFVCPSAIENSPNSLGEAQILGVPVVASYVGGVPDMVENQVSGLLYRFEEPEMLALAIGQIFTSDELCARLSEGGRNAASLRHDLHRNVSDLIGIYRECLN